MSLYRRGETWWVHIVHKGNRVRESTGVKDRDEAQRYHDRRKAELWDEQRTREAHSLGGAIALWLKSAERSEREKSALRVFLKLYHDRPLDEVSGADIASALLKKTPSTANRTINIIRAALRMAHQAGMLPEVPKIPKRKEPPQSIRFLTREEWDRLDKELVPHVQAAARFAVSTGLRHANVFGLKWRDVDLKRKIAWVHASEAKGKKAIGVPLNDMAVAAVKSQEGNSDEWVFTYAGRKIGSVKKAWHAALERAGIEDFVWHDLRHTWASWHVQNGTPLAVLKELGGWKSMDMVMRYAHLAPDHLAAWAGNAMTQNKVTKRRKAA